MERVHWAPATQGGYVVHVQYKLLMPKNPNSKDLVHYATPIELPAEAVPCSYLASCLLMNAEGLSLALPHLQLRVAAAFLIAALLTVTKTPPTAVSSTLRPMSRIAAAVA
jgi:hypothetical protein